MRTTQIIAFGFLAAIILGTLLLMLPVCAADGSWTSPVDALFTATTSMCVTGLVTLNTAAHWSLFGKVVILFLIQLGGLGVVTVSIMFLIVIGRRITLRERMLIHDSYNLDTLQGVVALIIRIIKGTLLVEAVGAVLYTIAFLPEYGFWGAAGRAVFNSVSAFCNAGMDILGDSSLAGYRTNVLVNVTTMLLIVIGGIGFVVWWDILGAVKQACKKDSRDRRIFGRLSLHSKVALSMTAILIAGGTVLYLLFEYHNPESIGGLPIGDKVMVSLFQSVTTRTAGFETISQAAFTPGATLLTMLLMFIGGSPAGTAGGIKTTTVGILACAVRSMVRGSKDTEVFGRKLAPDNIRTALAVVTISMGIVLGAVFVLFATDGLGFEDTLFEVFSAMGTVGLTRGITAGLSFIGKLVIILTMYAGRIGPITMALAFMIRRRSYIHSRDLPEKRVIIG